ncbi:hypothetical protein, partial [Rouxiella chamberiensis]|uniref:hypothetical protein n=1 Tax=Rouxiella chamberiensis TaxID=1513468 RepID=UPI0019D34C0D
LERHYREFPQGRKRLFEINYQPLINSPIRAFLNNKPTKKGPTLRLAPFNQVLLRSKDLSSPYHCLIV